jgi:predicted ribosome quality control (RQC) complex YloA/Tae2 family protein
MEFTFDDVDFLLKRNWFLDIDHVDELLWEISQEVFDKIFENRLSYTGDIYLLLRAYDPSLKRAGDLLDSEMAKIIDNESLQNSLKKEEELRAFIPTLRPQSSIDTNLNEVVIKFNQDLEVFQKMLRRPTFFKVEIANLNNDLIELESKIKMLTKKVENENKYWKEREWYFSRKTDLTQS